MSKCPFEHDEQEKCPVQHSTITADSAAKTVGSVANTVGNTANETLNQDRQESSIPKKDSTNWIYPSEEQFYQAMLRKNKRIGDVKQVVKIHNTVNERVWKEILEW
jgi:cytochrome c heme-lyase